MAAGTKPPAEAPARDGGLASRLAAYVCFGIAVGAPAAQSWSVLRFLPGEDAVGQFSFGTIYVFGTMGLARILWAPFLDAYRPPLLRDLGRRRGWVGFLLLLLALLAIGVGVTRPPGTDPLAGGPAYPVLLFLSLLTAGGLLAAVDGLRSVEPNPRQHGLLAAIQNIAIIVPPVVFLLVGLTQLDSPTFLWVSTALLAPGLVGLWLLPDGPAADPGGIGAIPRVRRFLEAQHNLSRSGKALVAWLYGVFACPVLDFFDRHGPAAWLALLVLFLGDLATLTFRINRFIPPFESSAVAEIFERIGPIAQIGQLTGAAFAAFLVYRLAPIAGLAVAFGVTAVSLALSILAILVAPAALPFAAAVVFDAFAQGTVLIAFVAFIARLLSPNFAALQFSLLWICAVPYVAQTQIATALDRIAGVISTQLIYLVLLALSIWLTLRLARRLDAPSSPGG